MDSAAVKSAQRVIEVLEYFTTDAHEATVMDVARALGYPQSSTSMLLASLEQLGYLQLSADKRKYSATLRVMLLGARMQSELFGEHNVLSAMESLRSRTQKTIMLGLRQNHHVRILVSLRSPASSLRFPVGTLRPVCRSAIGKVLLSLLPVAEAMSVIRYANATAPEEHKVDVPRLLEELDQVRETGWALTLGYPVPDRASLAVAAPPLPNQPALALNLGAWLEDLQDEDARAEYIRELKATSSSFLATSPER
jgi:DNA-binding IclR family transcriptional regulator